MYCTSLTKGKNCENERLGGDPKGHKGQPKGFVVLYKYRRVRCREGTFSQIDL